MVCSQASRTFLYPAGLSFSWRPSLKSGEFRQKEPFRVLGTDAYKKPCTLV